VERTVTAAFTVKWLRLGMGHYNARFFSSAAGVFPVYFWSGWRRNSAFGETAERSVFVG
jgi:hypothetical protein